MQVRKSSRNAWNGRSSLRKFIQDSTGSLDRQAMERALKDLEGSPSIIVATAGEPNAGAFDPIEELVKLAEQYNARAPC